MKPKEIIERVKHNLDRSVTIRDWLMNIYTFIILFLVNMLLTAWIGFYSLPTWLLFGIAYLSMLIRKPSEINKKSQTNK